MSILFDLNLAAQRGIESEEVADGVWRLSLREGRVEFPVDLKQWTRFCRDMGLSAEKGEDLFGKLHETVDRAIILDRLFDD